MNKKVMLVTGGSSGIGLAIMEKFLSSDEWVVISISRSLEKIENAKISLSKMGKDYEFFVGNTFDENSLREIIDVISNKYLKIDALVNCAGIIHPGGIESLSLDKWKNSIDINLTGIYLTTQLFLPSLKKSKCSSITNISSISSTIVGSSIAYSVSKAGLDMLTKVLAKELSQYNVRVNSVNPGIVQSGFQVANGIMKAEEYSGFLKNTSNTYPLGIGDPTDIANMVYYLTSEEAKWITGSIFTVDGGRSINT